LSKAKVSLVTAPLRAEVERSTLEAQASLPCLALRNRETERERENAGWVPAPRGKKTILFAAFTDDSNSQWLVCSASWQLALLAFIYGSAVMAIVIVTLMKSARKRRPEAQNKA
jgi:hypothetical protein